MNGKVRRRGKDHRVLAKPAERDGSAAFDDQNVTTPTFLSRPTRRRSSSPWSKPPEP